jgi:hypothetical protein
MKRPANKYWLLNIYGVKTLLNYQDVGCMNHLLNLPPFANQREKCSSSVSPRPLLLPVVIYNCWLFCVMGLEKGRIFWVDLGKNDLF